MRASVEGVQTVTQAEIGTLKIEARAESVASRLWRLVGRVFVREFGL